MQVDRFSTLWRKLHDHTGLSEYEAKIYVSLALMGPSEACSISKASGVPRTKVYKIIEKLREQGMIDRLPGKPAKFISGSPFNSFEVCLNSFEEKARELRRAVSILESEYEKTKVSAKIDRGDMWIFKGRREVLERIKEMLSYAKDNVFMACSSPNFVTFYKFFNKTIDGLLKRGVKIEIHTPIDFYNRSIAKELRYVCEVKQCAFMLPILLVLIDNEELLLANLTSQDSPVAGKEAPKDLGIYSKDPNLYYLFYQIFQPFIFSDAQSLEGKKQIRYVKADVL